MHVRARLFASRDLPIAGLPEISNTLAFVSLAKQALPSSTNMGRGMYNLSEAQFVTLQCRVSDVQMREYVQAPDVAFIAPLCESMS